MNGKRRSIHLTIVTGLAMAIAGAGGCGRAGGPERVVVSGSVLYHGQPIPNGRIRFTPAKDSAMPASGAFIVDGKYVADSQGGVPVGPCSIQIEAYRPLSGDGKPETAATHPGAGRVKLFQYLPKKFNADSRMALTIEPGSGKITQDFELKD
jgi:hypothetical protein